MSLVAYTDDAWPRLFALLENPGFLDDPRFETRRLRVQHMPEMYREVARLTPGFTSAELLRRCQEAQIPAMIACDLGEVMEDRHLKATGFFERTEHPTEGGWVRMRHPVRFGDYTPKSGFAPVQNQHGERIRGEAKKC